MIATRADSDSGGFELPTPDAPFNFEADQELLQALPLRAGAQFRIPFYHPGSGRPEFYLFKVEGEEKLDYPGGHADCWIVTTDYNDPRTPPTRFWIAKAKQLTLRTISELPDGSTIVKAFVP